MLMLMLHAVRCCTSGNPVRLSVDCHGHLHRNIFISINEQSFKIYRCKTPQAPQPARIIEYWKEAATYPPQTKSAPVLPTPSHAGGW